MKKRIKQTNILFALFVIMVSISGCGYPAFTSSMRSNFPSDVKIQMRCVHIETETSRDGSTLDKMLDKYSEEGWRLAYISEYTSTGITSFSNLICIERAVPNSSANLTGPSRANIDKDFDSELKQLEQIGNPIETRKILLKNLRQECPGFFPASEQPEHAICKIKYRAFMSESK